MKDGDPPVIVLGCPVADGGPACCDRCGGGWPGTRITTESLTRVVANGKIDPKKLGCQPLEDRARIGLAEVRKRHEQSGVLYDANPVP